MEEKLTIINLIKVPSLSCLLWDRKWSFQEAKKKTSPEWTKISHKIEDSGKLLWKIKGVLSLQELFEEVEKKHSQSDSNSHEKKSRKKVERNRQKIRGNHNFKRFKKEGIRSSVSQKKRNGKGKENLTIDQGGKDTP